MKTKVYLVRPNEKRRKLTPHPDFAVLDGPCPSCGAEVCKVQGTGKRIASDDRAYEADGIATCCDQHVGTIRAEVDTLFGLREDEAVLQGRCRVY